MADDPEVNAVMDKNNNTAPKPQDDTPSSGRDGDAAVPAAASPTQKPRTKKPKKKKFAEENGDPKKKGKKVATEHRCGHCSHARGMHAGRAGCAHLTGSTFCPCPGFRAADSKKKKAKKKGKKKA